MGIFKLHSKYTPSEDQQKAVDELSKFLNKGEIYSTLWGVTGSGKTFTMANLIAKQNKPTLIIAHNKTLAAQLAEEFKAFFPENAVHYFVSYYDYYQPEAYIQKTDTYIEKEATINEEIDRLRHAATEDLLNRKDVIIVASVSCIYGIGKPDNYMGKKMTLKTGENHAIEDILKELVDMQFTRAGYDFKPGNFQVMGDLLEIFPASRETVYSIEFWGDEIADIKRRNYLTGEVYEVLDEVTLFPAKHAVTTKDAIEAVIPQIESELKNRLEEIKDNVVATERLKTKVEYDIEMMREVGYVNGIENYSRYLDGRNAGDTPYTLMHYFGDDFLALVDESHMTLPQIGAMYNGDRARKTSLVENGFRLPSALDNRPLKFEEFEKLIQKAVLVSATPGKLDIERSTDNPDDFYNFDLTAGDFWKASDKARIVPQIMRPTGLLDPKIIVKDMEFMVDDIMSNINKVIEKNERMLITTLTKRSSEELTDYLIENGVKVKYLHSEIDTLERIEILTALREGKIDVIVGVNLLREGLDLPEVSKIAILDADKQGFLRSESSLIQIIGRAARNASGEVLMYSTKNPETLEPSISNAMEKAISLTNFRRKLQDDYNKAHNIEPKTVYSSIKKIGISSKKKNDYALLDEKSLKQEINKLELEMDIAAANMEFEKAIELRDTIEQLKKGKKKK
ncbi:MAG: excinuclease ABC subunit UvrB [Candidatus Gracilibacteria bacterium]|nr:excinuclease ABC subunit UvrB [Candidatus Gracilibacteria bacterium]